MFLRTVNTGSTATITVLLIDIEGTTHLSSILTEEATIQLTTTPTDNIQRGFKVRISGIGSGVLGIEARSCPIGTIAIKVHSARQAVISIPEIHSHIDVASNGVGFYDAVSMMHITAHNLTGIGSRT